jgi:hypothetical protein
MSELIVSIDSSAIREGKLEELKLAIQDLVEFVESNEPRPIAYSVYLNDQETQMTVLQVHPDSASMEYHMKVAEPAFRKFVDLILLSTMDIYGTPSEELLELLRHKVQMLGNATLVVYKLHAGFTRFTIH